MTKIKTLIKLKKDYIDKLKMFVPIVNRVHGKEHPEFNEVKVEFEIILKKIKNNDNSIIEQFDKLTTITNNYQIPENVCETYELVYQMLQELDYSYRSE